MNTSAESILEFLEQNAKWWEQAAVLCEQTVAQLEPGRREEWQLLGAVYRERAGNHAHLIEHLRQKGSPAPLAGITPNRHHSDAL